MICKFVVSLSVLLLAAIAIAQNAPVTPPLAPPSTLPATQPFVPHVATAPPGLHEVVVGEIRLYCQPADDQWIKTAVAAVKPASRPSTMPSDLVASLKVHRAELVKQFVVDMALSDDKAINEAIDQKLSPVLEAFVNLKPAIVFMPITQAKLTEAVKAGWTDPYYHFNRVADQAIYYQNFGLSPDYRMDDLVRWIPVDPNDDPAARDAKIVEQIQNFYANYYPMLSYSAQDTGLRGTLGEIINKIVIEPLKLPQDLQWFGRGIAAIYAVKYASMISGESRRDLTLLAILDEPGNPLHSQPLDLNHLKSQNELKPEFWLLYQHGLAKKGASVVDAWITKGGDGVLAKTLPKLRAAPPTDVPGLVAMIHDATTIDISPLLPPNYKVIVIRTGGQK